MRWGEVRKGWLERQVACDCLGWLRAPVNMDQTSVTEPAVNGGQSHSQCWLTSPFLTPLHHYAGTLLKRESIVLLAASVGCKSLPAPLLPVLPTALIRIPLGHIIPWAYINLFLQSLSLYTLPWQRNLGRVYAELVRTGFCWHIDYTFPWRQSWRLRCGWTLAGTGVSLVDNDGLGFLGQRWHKHE